ncbi:DUF6000 family protein [Chitinophaga sp. Cy-1792]|uniref:DUF6000 family protein n=1 Tax=Chitinophaga sp. Cy-1792 TaxID=2608339 RepID=UPI0014230909|nr:DUF6000 family protein [Chitinophaga sp. Cy-1792]NIG55387.1 hypothetical protein [Chitinophaga sp. Cy-1792]
MNEIERTLLKCLTNFNLRDRQEFLANADKYADLVTDREILEYLNSGWRQKLLASFCIAYKRRLDLMDEIVEFIFRDVTGKQIKGYLLCILVLVPRDQSISILLKYRHMYEMSLEMEWINQSLEYLAYYPVTGKENRVKDMMGLFI